MAKQLKLRRGTTAEHSTFIGASGEVTVDTTKTTLVVHDGVTPGGSPLVKEDPLSTRLAIMQAIYPVGSIYINASVLTNPAVLLGFGTWVSFGAGRVMVGLNGSDALFDTLEETGGSKDTIVVSHAHTASSTSTFSGNALPAHSHTLGAYVNDGGILTPTALSSGLGSSSTSSVSAGTPSGSVSTSTTVNSTGSSGANANLQPYITVAMWKRTV
jgi:hypothetical protein